MRVNVPNLDLERGYVKKTGTSAEQILVAGIDEVGRGAIAGNVSVGCVIIDPESIVTLDGVRDSKLLSAAVRESIVEPIKQWTHGWGVGHASSVEIDQWGISVALRLAGHRALKQAINPSHMPHHVFLDGSVDWLTPTHDLFSSEYDHEYLEDCPSVTTIVKGDLTSTSIAAASILAKVERDSMLMQLDQEHPQYGWARNKGYGSEVHRRAIQKYGATVHHRQTWLTKILQK